MTVKLPLLMFVMALLAILATGLVAYRVAKSALLEQAILRIEATTTERKNALSGWITQTRNDITFQVASPYVINALRAFEGAWSSSQTDPETYLRSVYVSANPNLAVDRDALEDPGDRSAYSRNHKKYHGYFQAIARQRGYGDIYLIGRTGAVLYSTFKTDEFARAETPDTLQAAVQAASAVPEGQGAMTDFRTSANGDVFIEFSAVVRDGGGKPMGILIYRIPESVPADLISNPAAMAADGASFILTDNSVVIGSQKRPIAPDAAANPDAVSPEIVQNVDVLQHDNGTWQVVTQKSMTELIKPANELLSSFIRQGSIILAIMTIAGIWMGRSIARPLAQVRASMQHISKGALDRTVPATGRRDEIGDIARTLKAFQGALRNADKTREDNRQKSAAMEASSAAIMILGLDGDMIYANPAVRAIMAKLDLDSAQTPGEGAPEWLPRILRDTIHAQDTDLTACNWVTSDVSLTLTLDAIRDPNCTLVGWVLEWTDVTDTHKAQAVMGTLDAYQIRADFAPDGTVISGNENWATCNSGPAADVDLASTLKGVPDIDWAALCDGAHWSGHVRVPTGDCVTVIQGSLSPVRDIDGSIRSIVLLGADVTEADRALQTGAATRKAMRAEQAQVVEQLRSGLARLSQGDLSVQIDAVFPNEYEQLRQDFNTATATLASALADVAQSSATIRIQSDEISSAAARLASQSETQAAALQLASGTIATLSSNADIAASEAKASSELAAHSTQNTHQHRTILEEASTAMQAILDSSKQIGEIVSVIDGIAFQTNLLSLNAGVEAARAGPAGRGFAVVANEVRALAQRSADAALEINQLITVSADHVRHGVALFEETGQALASVGTSVSDISDRMNAIASSGQDQSRAISQVNTSVSEIDQATQENAAMFEQTSAASRILLAQSEILMATLSVFTIDDQPPDTAPLKAAG